MPDPEASDGPEQRPSRQPSPSERSPEGSRPPDAAGLQLDCLEVPKRVWAAVKDRLGSTVVSATSQLAGFSSGEAARLETEDGRRFVVKAAGPEPNPPTPEAHRREARVVASARGRFRVPSAVVPRRGRGGWVVLVFEDVEGRNPAVP